MYTKCTNFKRFCEWRFKFNLKLFTFLTVSVYRQLFLIIFFQDSVWQVPNNVTTINICTNWGQSTVPTAAVLFTNLIHAAFIIILVLRCKFCYFYIFKVIDIIVIILWPKK